MSSIRTRSLAGSCLLFGLFISAPLQFAYADSGFYVGGSVGTAGTNLDDADFDFDEDDTAWKAYGGFNFDIIVVDLAIEAGYVNFGSPSGTVTDTGATFDVNLDVEGYSAFGLAGLELGPIGVFAKVGLVDWDIDPTIDGVNQDKQDGTDPAYGVGARFSLWSLEFRAEYERFEIDVSDVNSSDLDMISVGVVWTF